MESEPRSYLVVAESCHYTVLCHRLFINKNDGSATFVMYSGEEDIIVHHVKNYDSIDLTEGD